MKKSSKILMTGLLTFFISMASVFAKNVKVSDLLTEVENRSSDVIDVYIIGEYAFTTNHRLTSQDIMLAARSINVETEGKTNQDPAYQEMVMQHINREMNKDGTYGDWNIVNPKIGTPDKKVTKDDELDIHFIDYEPFDDPTKEVEPELVNDARTLNETAKNYGFNSIDYKNHTLTFDIQDLSKQLVGYANSGIVKMFTDVVNGKYGFEKITYTGIKENEPQSTPIETEEKTKTKNDLNNDDEKITTLAADVLLALAAKENGNKLTLTYQDVANKSTTATVVYKNEDGIEITVVYTLSFVYNIETAKDTDLEAAAKKLDGENHNEAIKYGFKEISYDKESRTATFEISDTNKSLSAFAESKIIDLFQEYIVGATKVVYTVGDKTETIQPIDTSKGGEYAGNVLCLMVTGNKDCNQDEGPTKQELTLGSVAGKEATATITYVIGDQTKEIIYTLKFAYNLNEEKNETLEHYATALNDNAKKGDLFSSIEYDPATRTATFTVKNKDKKLNEFPGKEDIIQMFQAFVKDASAIKWSAGDKKDQSVDLNSQTTNEATVSLAANLLCAMAGKECSIDSEEIPEDKKCNPLDLKLEEVLGKEATATVTYKVGDVTGTETYTLKFVDGTSAALNQVFNGKKTFID